MASLENYKYDPQSMLEEYNRLKDELERYDKVYEEVSETIKEARKNKSRTPYVFLASQYSTLTAINNSRQSVISKLFDMKKIIEEFKIKSYNLNSKDVASDSDSKEIIKGILLALSNKDIPQDEVINIRSTEAISLEVIENSSSEGIGNVLDNMFEELKD